MSDRIIFFATIMDNENGHHNAGLLQEQEQERNKFFAQLINPSEE